MELIDLTMMIIIIIIVIITIIILCILLKFRKPHGMGIEVNVKTVAKIFVKFDADPAFPIDEDVESL